MLQLGGLLPQLAPGHQVPIFNSWVDWSNVSKVLTQGNSNNTKVAQLRIEPGTFPLPGRRLNHLAMLPHTHTHAHTHAPTHTHTHTHTPGWQSTGGVLPPHGRLKW